MKRLLLSLALSVSLSAQTALSVNDLVKLVRSSVQLHHPDKQVAQFLHGIKLKEKLEDSTIEELQSAGAGAKTVAALRELGATSATLPAAPPPPVKVAAPVLPGPDAIEQKKIIDEAREYALNYSKQLPNFICLQVTERYYDPTLTENWRKEDVIHTRLSYFEQHEDYKVISVNNKPSDISMERLGGAISTGEFGTHLLAIFSPRTHTRFEWERWGTVRGKRAYVFSYVVEQPDSDWHIIVDRTLDIIPGYKGNVFIDKDSLSIVRLTLEPFDLPASFPVKEAATVLDYDYQPIGEQKYMLPLKAVIRSRSAKLLTRNDVTFRSYRKFGTEATITFDSPEEDDKNKTKPKP